MFPQHSSLLYTLAGISFFMFGMTLASDNLQKLAANRIRDLLGKLSDRPIIGVLVGIALTVVIQSSGAVTSMLVGLGSAGVISLPQVMSVILGTAVGTTFTVQLISLNVAQFGLPIFTFSFAVYFLTRRRVLKQLMGVLMGFGLIFWGLELIGVGTNALRTAQIFTNFLDYLKDYPIYTVLITAFFTAVVHSSAVTIGFAMSLAASGLISIVDAIYWVYGANIGTTATALLASAGGNYVGRQVAWAHAFYKILSVALFYFFTEMFAGILGGENVQRDIANAHTLFNLAAAVIFYFFIDLGARAVQKMFPPSKAEQEFTVKFLDRRNFESSSVAIAHAEREVLRMGDIVLNMVRDSLELFRNDSPELEEAIRERDNRVDLLNREINLFLANYMYETEGGLQTQMLRVMSFAADLESTGDAIDNNILDLARKKHALKVDFSAEGWADLETIHRQVVELAALSLSCFQLQDKDLAAKVVFKKREIRKQEREFREAHMARLVKGKKETINTSSIHLDVLGEYRHISGLMSNHVYALLKESDKYNILPRRET